MNALDISKCRLDAVSGARHLACFLVNGAGCCFVGDQPVPPAGDRAVTPRLSEPPRMPKPARCGRRCLICNRRGIAAVRALRPHYCRLRWLVRRVELRAASPGFAPCDWHFASSSIALSLFDLGFGCTAAQGNEPCENRWPSCSHERTENQMRIPPSNIVSPKHRWSHRRAGRLRGVAWRGIDRPNLCLPRSSPPQFSGRSRRS